MRYCRVLEVPGPFGGLFYRRDGCSVWMPRTRRHNVMVVMQETGRRHPPGVGWILSLLKRRTRTECLRETFQQSPRQKAGDETGTGGNFGWKPLPFLHAYVSVDSVYGNRCGRLLRPYSLSSSTRPRPLYSSPLLRLGFASLSRIQDSCSHSPLISHSFCVVAVSSSPSITVPTTGYNNSTLT